MAEQVGQSEERKKAEEALERLEAAKEKIKEIEEQDDLAVGGCGPARIAFHDRRGLAQRLSRQPRDAGAESSSMCGIAGSGAGP